MGLVKVLVSGSLAYQERVRDDLDELWELENVRVGTSSVAIENVVEDVIGSAKVEQTQNGIRERQTLTDLAFKGVQGVPSRKNLTTPGDNL